MWLEAMLYVEKTKKFHSWDFIWFLFCELARDCVQGCVFKNLRKIKMLFLLFLVGLGCVVPVSIVDWWNVKEKLWSILSMWVLSRLCGFLLIFLGFSLVKNVKKVGKWENAVCLCLFLVSLCHCCWIAVNCVVSNWTDWSKCHNGKHGGVCGWGHKHRHRQIKYHAKNGGTECPKLKDSMKCYIGKCKQKNHFSQGCLFLMFRSRLWTRVSQKNPKKWETFCVFLALGNVDLASIMECKNVIEKSYNTQKCVSVIFYWPFFVSNRVENHVDHIGITKNAVMFFKKAYNLCTIFCNLAFDCIVSEWTPWGPCHKKWPPKHCGKGHRHRRRRIKYHPKNGGEKCPKLKDTEKCDLPPCSKFFWQICFSLFVSFLVL